MVIVPLKVLSSMDPSMVTLPARSTRSSPRAVAVPDSALSAFLPSLTTAAALLPFTPMETVSVPSFVLPANRSFALPATPPDFSAGAGGAAALSPALSSALSPALSPPSSFAPATGTPARSTSWPAGGAAASGAAALWAVFAGAAVVGSCARIVSKPMSTPPRTPTATRVISGAVLLMNANTDPAAGRFTRSDYVPASGGDERRGTRACRVLRARSRHARVRDQVAGRPRRSGGRRAGGPRTGLAQPAGADQRQGLDPRLAADRGAQPGHRPDAGAQRAAHRGRREPGDAGHRARPR